MGMCFLSAVFLKKVIMAKSPETSSKNFQFRDLRQNLFIGTASDRYAGWIGQDSEKRIAHGA
jgi:hypothetical protein